MPQPIVVDTSVFSKWVNTSYEEHLEEADSVLRDAREQRIELFAPELAKYELGNVLLKGKKLEPHEAYISLETAYTLPIAFIPGSLNLAHETFELAYQAGMTYYDAAFVALAKELRATLVTDNPKHQKKGHGVRVVSLADYTSVT